MIKNYRVLIWFSCQLSIAIGGAVGAYVDGATAIGAFVISLVITGLCLQQSWKVREHENALKQGADVMAVVGIIAFVFMLMTSSLIWALGLLLFFAQQALNLLLREYRQLYFGLVIGFVFVLAGAAESKSGWYLVIFCSYGLCVSFCLAEAWLDNVKTTKNDAPSTSRPPTFARLKVATTILSLAMVIYLVTPRPPAAHLGGQQSATPDYYTNKAWEQEAESAEKNPDSQQSDATDTNSDAPKNPPQENQHSDSDTDSTSSGNYGYRGFDQQFDINDAGKQGNRNSNEIVAHMKAPHGAYLKVRTFDTFDGLSWSVSTTQYTKKLMGFGSLELTPNAKGNFRQEITIAQTLPAWLPAASKPVELWFPTTVIALDAWQHPLLPGPLVADTRYTVESDVQLVDNRAIGGTTAPSPADLKLPDDFEPRIRQLAESLTEADDTALAQATTIEQHLRSEYQYSFSSIFDSQGVTPLSTFLFEEKSGHCEYFASAMAIMLRSIGIPSRLITGFSATQKNPLTGYYEIRALDGHAWVEAWIEGVGWLTFEPTAFYNLPAPQEQPLSASQINEYVKSLQHNEQALETGEITMTGMLTGLWQSLAALFILILSYIKLLLSHAWPFILIIATVWAALFYTRHYWQPTLIMSWSMWKIRHYSPTDSRQAVYVYLWYLQRMGECINVQRQPGEPLASWVDRLSSHSQNDPSWQSLVEQVNQTIYTDKSSTTAELRKLCIAAATNIRRYTKGKNALRTLG